MFLILSGVFLKIDILIKSKYMCKSKYIFKI